MNVVGPILGITPRSYSSSQPVGEFPALSWSEGPVKIEATVVVGSQHKSISVRMALAIARVLDDSGADGELVARRAGIGPAFLSEATGRIPIDQAAEFWALAAETVEHDKLGLEVAKELRTGTHEGFLFAMLASASVHEALHRMVRFQKVIGDLIRVELCEEEGGCAIVVCPAALPVTPRADAVDCAVGCILGGLRDFLRDQMFSPSCVELKRLSAPVDSPLVQFVNAPVRTACDRDALLFSNVALERELPSADRELAAQMDEVVSRFLAGTAHSGFAQALYRAVLENLSLGQPVKAKVAKDLGISSRTLQRRLEELGTSFRDVVAEVRCSLADRLLKQNEMSVTEVAFLLGFSDSTSFSRAYRRWTGAPPSAQCTPRTKRT